jgi:NADH dehydrogenase FAD-containing subunit
MARRVLLLGAGPAHLQLLQALARQPLAGAEVALLSPFAQQAQAPLLPGLVAGYRRLDDCLLPLQPLAAAAQVHFIEAQVVALDAAARRVSLGDGRQVDYDLLSINSTPAQDRGRIPGARERGLFLRPHESFARLLEGLWDLAAQRVLDVVVVGGGVEAVELALALACRLGSVADERARVALVTGGDVPLADCPAGLQQRAQRALARRRITVFRDHCRAVEPGAVVLGQGARLACDAPLLAMPGEAPPWLSSSGLSLDASGWAATGPTLQSLSHPEVLAVSAAAPGVAHTLEANLRGLVGGGPLSAVKAHRQPPCFVETGDRRALVAWGRLSAEGRWVQWWKDRREAGRFTRSA